MLRPRLEPPGGTFRCEVLQGFSFLTDEELAAVIREVRWHARSAMSLSGDPDQTHRPQRSFRALPTTC